MDSNLKPNNPLVETRIPKKTTPNIENQTYSKIKPDGFQNFKNLTFWFRFGLPNINILKPINQIQLLML